MQRLAQNPEKEPSTLAGLRPCETQRVLPTAAQACNSQATAPSTHTATQHQQPQPEHTAQCLPEWTCEDGKATGPQSLFERQAPQDYYDQWSKMIQEGNRTRPGQVAPWIVFQLREYWFALPAKMIKQVIPAGPIHPVPGKTSSLLLGVVKAHGELPIAVDLEKLLFGEHIACKTATSHEAQYAGQRHIWVEQGIESFIFPSIEVLELQYMHTGIAGERLKKLSPEHPFFHWSGGQVEYDAKTIFILDCTRILHALRTCLRWEEHG